MSLDYANKKYKITGTYEKDGTTISESAKHRISREGFIYFLHIGGRMEFGVGGIGMRTSAVEDIKETDGGFVVYTRNTIYEFSEVKEGLNH